MSDAIDTSILVAAIVAAEEFHAECARLLDAGKKLLYSHGLSEAFSTLTGGRRFRIAASTASAILGEDYAPQVKVVGLSPGEILHVLSETEPRGVRGGAVFDYLHLAAARKAKAERFYTLNVSNFRAFHRPGDPQILHPAPLRARGD
ncbi:MAG: PIN domain-containing protein [Verrucomicrobiae bacterium]|nr:PIN domain-containing protein [Verrucomicrobiae bacterium]